MFKHQTQTSMKPHVFLFRIILTMFVLISVMSFSLFESFLLDDDNEYYNSDYELIVYCRCHSDDNQCYGGNAISFRKECHSEPVKENQTAYCHAYDTKCSSGESEPELEPETEFNP